ncbi:hypothetical protein C1H46_023114 [Malus baccata]|uniref:Uncharacterized protein n=1 Tax=Malus baccata TaxID=106549 RepID=A0A540LYG2_MALBA|nr:hypothetical protein C1H46_023114 [Malus baccata]
MAVVIIYSGDDNAYHHLIKDPKPPKAIWELSGNMEKAYWCKYSNPSSYDTPWPQVEGWGDEDANLMDFSPSLSDEVFTIDMQEEYNKETLEEQLFCK